MIAADHWIHINQTRAGAGDVVTAGEVVKHHRLDQGAIAAAFGAAAAAVAAAGETGAVVAVAGADDDAVVGAAVAVVVDVAIVAVEAAAAVVAAAAAWIVAHNHVAFGFAVAAYVLVLPACLS